jgi:LPXTG-site transpeptidase (sortase) family protein
VNVRKLIGLAFFISGGLLLSFVGGRYAVGIAQADEARHQWEAGEAHRAVARARELAAHQAAFLSAPASGAPVARLVIPKIDLDEIVIEGVDDDALNAGPGHLPGSVLPGVRGNAIVSAHRDRHFSHFDLLKVGDTVLTDSRAGKLKWVIVSQRIVDKDSPALFATSDTTLTLTTCWPIRFIGSAPERLIVTAKPLGRLTPRLASAN